MAQAETEAAASAPAPLSSISELTADWLSQALNTPIAAFTSQRIGTGQVSAVHRLTLTYGASAPPSSPATVIFKVPSDDDGSRSAGVLLGLYERETRFYAEVVPQLTAQSALSACHYSRFDADTGNFSILLSDGAPAHVGNELAGASLPQAQLAVRALGQLHGQALRSAALHASEWLNRPPPVSGEMMRALCGEFLEIYGAQIAPEHALVARRVVAAFDEMTALWQRAEVVRGLIHGDFRMDNLLFGEEGAALPLTVVDWQTVTFGPFMSDFSYFLGASLPTELRRKHADELLQIYYDALGQDPPVTLEQCRAGLREQSFFGITMSIISPIMVERTERGDEMFMTMFERSCAQVIDLDALALLPSPGDESVRAPLRPVVKDEALHEPKREMHWQESFYLDFIDPEQDLGGYIRIGLDPKNQRTWYTLLLCGKDRPTVTIVDFEAPVPGDDLRVQTSAFQASHSDQKPLESFHVLVDGKARSYADPSVLLQEEAAGKGTPETVRLYLAWKTAGIPYQYRLTTRYEIPCLVSGTISIGDEIFFLHNALGQRDHSWGARDWWSMDWVWSAVHLDDATRIHGLDLRVPNAPRLGMGYIQQPAAATAVVGAQGQGQGEASGSVVQSAQSTERSQQGALPPGSQEQAQVDPVSLAPDNADTSLSTADTAPETAPPAQAPAQAAFEPLPLTASTTEPATTAPAAAIAASLDAAQPHAITELTSVKSSETFTSTGLIATCTHELEYAPFASGDASSSGSGGSTETQKETLRVEFEPCGHAPLRLVSGQGQGDRQRVAQFARAWGRVRVHGRRDGVVREGWSWMEWNRNGVS